MVVRLWTKWRRDTGTCRHPSVSRNYGNMLWIEVFEQRLVWLRRPIWEWQSLPHWRQIQSVPCPVPWFGWFWDFLFASACWTRVSSKWERLWSTACLQAKHSHVNVSHLLRSISKAFRSCLQISLYSILVSYTCIVSLLLPCKCFCYVVAKLKEKKIKVLSPPLRIPLLIPLLVQ